MEKSEVRALAEKYDLPVMHKKDSQGLCFVGDITLPEFLSRYIDMKRGDILDESGAVLGFHDGAMLFTKGQRHGFTLTGQAEMRPHYVIATDIAANTITVSTDAARAATRRVVVGNMHWIGDAPALPADFSVQARYRETPVEARVSSEAGRCAVEFPSPHLASAGQSLVVYDGDVCLGGGDISAL